MASYKKEIRRYIDEFIAEQKDDRSFEKIDVAMWLLKTGRVKREKGYLERLSVQKLGEECAQVMRESHARDAQGRVVRDLLSARIGGKVKWNTRARGSHGFLRTSSVQRREQIVDDCHRLKVDVDSINENRFPDRPIQISFDFRQDLAELEAAERSKKDDAS